MPNIDEGAKAWEMKLSGRIGVAVQARRKQLKMTAQQLAERTKEQGYPMTRVAISKIETNTRAGKFDIAELLVLAAVLEVPPVTLLFGGPPDEEVEMLPDWTGPAFFGIAWFSGDRDLAWPGPAVDPEEARDQADAAVADPGSPAATVLRLMRQRAGLHRDYALDVLVGRKYASRWSGEEFDRKATRIGRLTEKIDETTHEINKVIAEKSGETE